jgi:uncharacterized protein with PIN domain
MPNLGPLRRKSDSPRGGAITERQCALCGENLRLVRRHMSPVRLGPPLATEFYQCDACDSAYMLNPVTGKWKAWVADDED